MSIEDETPLRFELKKPFDTWGDSASFLQFANDPASTNVENILYQPDNLISDNPPRKLTFQGKTFKNVSFSKTHLSYLDFKDCTFSDCIFIGSIIENCIFRKCSFIRCNFYNSAINNCDIDPTSFENCANKETSPDIGTGLFRELLHNSRQIANPDYGREARYQFRRWQRYEKLREFKLKLATSRIAPKSIYESIKMFALLTMDWVYEVFFGYGMRLKNFILTSLGLLMLLTAINWFFRDSFKLMLDDKVISSVADAIYFSVIVVTTLGFGDITPATQIGKIFIAFESLIGFVMFAVLTSIIFKRIAE